MLQVGQKAPSFELPGVAGGHIDAHRLEEYTENCWAVVLVFYAVGDTTPGHNQVPIAYGDGAKAGISIHFALRDFPRDPDRIEEAGPVRSEEMPGIPDELLEQAVDFHTYD